MIAKLTKGRIIAEGMGGFLNPPGHPEHAHCVETDLRRRPENRGSMSLSAAVDCEWLDAGTRAAARRVLRSWKRPAIDSPAVVAWVREVLGYFKGCYKGLDSKNPLGESGEESAGDEWHVGQLRIDRIANPMLNVDIHAGVHFIREFYPEFVPVAADFENARWGS